MTIKAMGLEKTALFERLQVLVAGLVATLVVSLSLSISMPLAAQEAVAAPAEGSYVINAGDVLKIDVWGEASLSLEQALVRPDGFLSVPVVGEVAVGRKTIADAQRDIAAKLRSLMRDEPSVVISLLSTQGSRVFVLGKVQRPGAFALIGDLDVAQALALAGGLNQFAAENKIKVLRRDEQGRQQAYRFRYSGVKDGSNLKSNILLKSGDVVLVP